MGFEYFGILLAVSAILCSVGFYKYVYFLSIGYGFAVAGVGFTLATMSMLGYFHTSFPHYFLLLLLIVYGLRLSGFLIAREVKNSAYRETLKEACGNEAKMPIFVKVVIWVSVSILYVAQTSPVFFRIYNGGKSSITAWVGIGICTAALIIESAADKQKSMQKLIHPDMVAMGGLYKIVRCPNYFGEILFWTGVFISGIDILSGWGQWLTAGIAYACIVYIMFNGAQRLEKRQMKKYADNAQYKAYTDKTPIIIPLLPLYHLNKKPGRGQKESKIKHKKLNIFLLVIASILCITVGCTLVYVSNYYHASEEAVECLAAADKINHGYYVFGEDNADKGLIFYPGGKVEYTSYAPLMKSLAQHGFKCILIDMPANLAVLNKNAADGLQELYPNIKNWYIGGHSLGGAMAAAYVTDHTQDYKGLILLAAYSTADISRSNLEVLTMYGTEDGVLNRDKLRKYATNLPKNAKTVVLSGGCHSYFGDYGQQSNDGIPKITRSEQVQQTVDTIISFTEVY